MRKRTLRNGLRCVLVSLLLIIVCSYFLGSCADVFSLAPELESRLYRSGMFTASFLGCFGAVQSVFGLIRSARRQDVEIRLFPILLMVVGAVFCFFFLLSVAIDGPSRLQRSRPDHSLTI